MDIHEELRINDYQPTYGWSGTEVGTFFQAILDRNTESGFTFEQSAHLLLSQAFTYGIICSKREERIRRKGKHI